MAAMKTLELIKEIIATYQRHGWKLRRVLLRPTTRAEVNHQAREVLKEARFVDAEFDALWFARPSHQGREAWELRLLAQQLSHCLKLSSLMNLKRKGKKRGGRWKIA